jgi:hypothetical protein
MVNFGLSQTGMLFLIQIWAKCCLSRARASFLISIRFYYRLSRAGDAVSYPNMGKLGLSRARAAGHLSRVGGVFPYPVLHIFSLFTRQGKTFLIPICTKYRLLHVGVLLFNAICFYRLLRAKVHFLIPIYAIILDFHEPGTANREDNPVPLGGTDLSAVLKTNESVRVTLTVAYLPLF